MLQEEEIRYVFNEPILKPGDILLMNTYEERMRARMQCKFEHVAIYLGDAYLMEADGAFVVMNHIYSHAFKNIEDAKVYRLKQASPVTLGYVVRHAMEQMGQKYANTRQWFDVRPNKTTDKKDTSNRSFCSRLVAQCYERENIHIVSNADYCEPDDFLSSDLLFEVDHPLQPFNEEMKLTVMNGQREREKSEGESPNAELFEALSLLYGEDIQTLGQAMLSASHHVDKDDEAIAIIDASKMFKFKHDMMVCAPWFFDDDAFFNNFPTTKDALFFLNSRFLHFDKTYLTCFKQNYFGTTYLASLRPDSRTVAHLKDCFQNVLDEAIEIRKRLAYLYEETFKRHKEEFIKFADEYGYYEEYEYVEKPTDIGFILHAILQASFKNTGI